MSANSTLTHIPARDAGKPERSWWIGLSRGPEWTRAIAEYVSRWQTARRTYKGRPDEPNRETWQ